MATNHGFADGNKRTTVLRLDTLLTKSGYRLRPLRGDRSMDRAIEAMVLDVIARHMNFDDLVAWLKTRLVPIRSRTMREA
jgi:prophage maintenance system killer protein